MSLANHYLYEGGDSSSSSETIVHLLETAGIRWLGLNVKHHEIVVMGGEKVGFLAFCGVYGKCLGSSNLPFAPLKYTVATARKAVEDLRQVIEYTFYTLYTACFLHVLGEQYSCLH